MIAKVARNLSKMAREQCVRTSMSTESVSAFDSVSNDKSGAEAEQSLGDETVSMSADKESDGGSDDEDAHAMEDFVDPMIAELTRASVSQR